MAFLLDTNVAIHLRDGDPAVTQRVAALEGAVLISVVTRVELEGGVYQEPAHAPIRRARLDAMLSAIPALAFDDLAAKTYGDIVASAGYSRQKMLDRMIAAQVWCTGRLWSPSTLMTFPMSLVSRRWCGHFEAEYPNNRTLGQSSDRCGRRRDYRLPPGIELQRDVLQTGKLTPAPRAAYLGSGRSTSAHDTIGVSRSRLESSEHQGA